MRLEKIVPWLLDWFGHHARDLPWRRTQDPYAIWVSEIMLQQTQVKTVLPYWERWMKALPTIASLAAARPEKIHKLWEGLGYYTRVRNMQKAARLIVDKHAGQFPSSFQDVLDLPGIGRYTAGAVCSIAFNQPRPVLDGNVIRVLTRVFGINGDPKEKMVNAELWRLAERLVRDATRLGRASPQAYPGDLNEAAHWGCSHLNQSLMELGALVCTPRHPACQVCPLGKGCIARKQGRTEELPGLAPRAKTTKRRFLAFVVEREGRFLVRQRPAGGVNAHLWEFPNTEVYAGDGDPNAAARKALGFTPSEIKPLASISHSITRYRIRMEVFQAAAKNGIALRRLHGYWFTRTALRRLPFASAHKKILDQDVTRLPSVGRRSSRSAKARGHFE
jgi:A/G-specific adenine glycosylase